MPMYNGKMYDPCPYTTKLGLVNWASKRFKKPRSYYKPMTKKQLYGLWKDVATGRIK